MAKPKPIPGGTNEVQDDASGARRRVRGRRARGSEHGTSHTTDDPREKRLSDLLDQFGGGGFRLLAERTVSDGTTEYLGPVPFNADLYESVRLRWGGGLFGGRVVNERGQYQARFPQFRIGGPPRQPGHDDASAHGAASPTPTPGIEATLASITATLGKIAERLATPPAPLVDPLDQALKVARVVRDMGAANAPQQTDTMAVVRELYAFTRELREEAAPAPADSGFGVVMREGVNPLIQVLTRKLELDEQREQRRRLPKGTAPALPAAAPVAPAASPPDDAVTDNIPADELEALLMTVPTAARRFLLSCAENDDDPEDYVALLLNKLSDDGYEAMVRNLPRPDFLEVLIRVVPAYGTYREWFSNLVSALREAVSVETDSVVQQDGERAPAQGAPA